MRVLLDTHILLWALAEPERLPAKARDAVEDPESEILFSAASIWEIAIKSSLGRMRGAADPQDIVRAAEESGFVELPVHSEAAALVATLPWHHRDPFDRLLLAQAMAEPALFATADRALARYSHQVKLL